MGEFIVPFLFIGVPWCLGYLALCAFEARQWVLFGLLSAMFLAYPGCLVLTLVAAARGHSGGVRAARSRRSTPLLDRVLRRESGGGEGHSRTAM